MVLEGHARQYRRVDQSGVNEVNARLAGFRKLKETYCHGIYPQDQRRCRTASMSTMTLRFFEVLRDVLGMTGTNSVAVRLLGGACSWCVLTEIRCAPASRRWTVSGIRRSQQSKRSGRRRPAPTSRKAWLERQVPQCGYCQSGANHVCDSAAGDQLKSERHGYR